MRLCVAALQPHGHRGKMRKAHSEHFSTAVPHKADVVLTAANGSFVPRADSRTAACYHSIVKSARSRNDSGLSTQAPRRVLR